MILGRPLGPAMECDRSEANLEFLKVPTIPECRAS